MHRTEKSSVRAFLRERELPFGRQDLEVLGPKETLRGVVGQGCSPGLKGDFLVLGQEEDEQS